MADVGPAQRAQVRLPANARAIFFEELQESLPSSVAYVHGEQFWFNLGYYYDKVHQQLGGQVEPYRRFTEIIFKKLSEADVQQKLGDCMYLKPSTSSGRQGLVK